jgi:hypothetical protein
VLGDLPVDAVTPVMLGEVLDAIRHSRKSLALQERVRSPLRAYYRHLIKRQGFTGRNPAEDLSDYMVHGLSKRAPAVLVSVLRAVRGGGAVSGL